MNTTTFPKIAEKYMCLAEKYDHIPEKYVCLVRFVTVIVLKFYAHERVTLRKLMVQCLITSKQLCHSKEASHEKLCQLRINTVFKQ